MKDYWYGKVEVTDLPVQQERREHQPSCAKGAVTADQMAQIQTDL